MLVYVVTIILAFLSGLLFDYSKNVVGTNFYRKKTNIVFLIISGLVLIIVTGFRYQVGADYLSYQDYFYQVLNYGDQGRFEFGYYIINYICAHVSDNPRLLFVVTAAIFYSFIYASLYKSSPFCSLSIFLIMGSGVFFYFMNGMRQMLASALFLFSIVGINNECKFKKILLILIAALFHKIAIFGIVCIFFDRLTINFKNITIVAVAALCLYLYFNDFANYIADFFGYSEYIRSDRFTARFGLVQVLINASILLFAFFAYLKSDKDDNLMKVLIWMQFITLLFSMMTGKIVLIQRIQLLFGIQQIILIPRALSYFGCKYLRDIMMLTIVVVYVVYIYITVYLWNGNSVLPYNWSL